MSGVSFTVLYGLQVYTYIWSPPRVKTMNEVLRSLLRVPLRGSKQGTATSESQMRPLPCCLPPAPCQVMDKARGSLWPDLDIGERGRENSSFGTPIKPVRKEYPLERLKAE